MPLNLFLRIEYLGGAYAGSQIQKNSITIQEHLNKALSRVFTVKMKTVFAGRTDSGVHALGQAVTVPVPKRLMKIKTALNSLLPPDIRVREAEYCSAELHARYSAESREYLYNIYCAEQPLLSLQGKVWQIPQKLNIRRMRRAAKLFRGRQDFAAFCAAGGTQNSTVRKVKVSELLAKRIPVWPGAKEKSAGLLLTYRIEADGFLYHQVRNIVAALVAVGLGKMSVAELQAVLRSGKKRGDLKAPTAPAEGLVLYNVKYVKRRKKEC